MAGYAISKLHNIPWSDLQCELKLAAGKLPAPNMLYTALKQEIFLPGWRVKSCWECYATAT